jgi:hypothetical protein
MMEHVHATTFAVLEDKDRGAAEESPFPYEKSHVGGKVLLSAPQNGGATY